MREPGVVDMRYDGRLDTDGLIKKVERLKVILREEDCPFFTDDEILFYLDENGGDFDGTAYQCLIVKSESTSLIMSGLEVGDTSKYFRRLAQRYRKTNSRVLGE